MIKLWMLIIIFYLLTKEANVNWTWITGSFIFALCVDSGLMLIAAIIKNIADKAKKEHSKKILKDLDDLEKKLKKK